MLILKKEEEALDIHYDWWFSVTDKLINTFTLHAATTSLSIGLSYGWLHHSPKIQWTATLFSGETWKKRGHRVGDIKMGELCWLRLKQLWRRWEESRLAVATWIMQYFIMLQDLCMQIYALHQQNLNLMVYSVFVLLNTLVYTWILDVIFKLPQQSERKKKKLGSTFFMNTLGWKIQLNVHKNIF